jgi:hypothetical protein
VSYILFLNELSFGTATDRWAADAAMVEFDKLVRMFYEWNQETSIVDHIGLSSIELAPGYSIKAWINAERGNRDRWQFIRLRQGKAPFKDPELPNDVEYKYHEQPVQGLGFADHFYGLCLSLRVSDAWDTSEIVVDRLVLGNDDAKGAEVQRKQRQVLHSGTCENAAGYESRWREQSHRLPVKRLGRRFRHFRFGIMVECLDSEYFYSVDHAGHGTSAVKRFIERADGLHWDADLDKSGSVIENKHKSDTGKRIPKNELHAV